VIFLMTDMIRAFVMEAHRDLEKVKDIYADHPDLIDEPIEWSPGQTETPLQAAAHTGRREIAEFLLEKGAQPNMVVYAMLGDEAQFNGLLAENPDNINEIGAHQFSLMFHAALGGNLNIIQTIHENAENSDLSKGLLAAVMTSQVEAAEWFIEQGVPLDATDFRGRTALEMAVEMEADDLVAVLQDAIGAENLESCPNCGAKGYKYLAELDGSPMGAHTKIFNCKKCGHEIDVVKVG